MEKKILFIGTGYVGLVNAACFAKFGHDVLCYDVDEVKIAGLKEGKLSIYEEGLADLISEHLGVNLNFTDNLNYELVKDRVIFIAVGTPSKENSYETDLTYVQNALNQLCNLLKGHEEKIVFVMKSTVPVGTADNLKNFIKQNYPDLSFDLVSNPEFLREGVAVYDCLNPDRVIIGSCDADSAGEVKLIHNYLEKKGVPFVLTDNKTAEIIKYASNSFLAAKIAFMNEMAHLCSKTGASIKDLKEGMGLDHRINKHHLNPGPGFGGSCFPKDVRSLIFTAEKYDSELVLTKSIIESNEKIKEKIASKIIRIAKENTENNNIINILGVTFKANTNDVRESPSIDIIKYLQKAGLEINIHDSKFTKDEHKVFHNVNMLHNLNDIGENGIFVLLAGHKEYKQAEFINSLIKIKPVQIIDLRNFYDNDDIKHFLEAGIKYYDLSS